MFDMSDTSSGGLEWPTSVRTDGIAVSVLGGLVSYVSQFFKCVIKTFMHCDI